MPITNKIRGSIFNADHPQNGVNIPRRFTAEEIRAEIERRIQADPTGQCRDCEAPMPVPIDRRDGVNWSVDNFPKLVPGCTAFVMRVLSDMMMRYDLVSSEGKMN